MYSPRHACCIQLVIDAKYFLRANMILTSITMKRILKLVIYWKLRFRWRILFQKCRRGRQIWARYSKGPFNFVFLDRLVFTCLRGPFTHVKSCLIWRSNFDLIDRPLFSFTTVHFCLKSCQFGGLSSSHLLSFEKTAQIRSLILQFRAVILPAYQSLAWHINHHIGTFRSKISPRSNSRATVLLKWRNWSAALL